MSLPLRKKDKPAKTTTNPEQVTDDRPEGTAIGDDAPLPGTPEQGSDDDGSGFVPSAPVLPSGRLLCEFSSVARFITREGTRAVSQKTGQPVDPKVMFKVVEKKQLEAMTRGESSCYGAEVGFGLDLGAQWYARTIRYMTILGLPASSWPKQPKTPKNPQGQPTLWQLCDFIDKQLAGKRFYLTMKLSHGKGENKDQVYSNVEKIEPGK